MGFRIFCGIHNWDTSMTALGEHQLLPPSDQFILVLRQVFYQPHAAPRKSCKRCCKQSLIITASWTPPLTLACQRWRRVYRRLLPRDYCKTTVTIQQFSSPETPEQNSLSKWDRCTIMKVAQCMLNQAALSKSLWGKMATTAVFLLNHPPNKTICGDTPSYRTFDKCDDLSFLWTVRTR